jgi:3-hydroxyacyl-CoA dehydrogenase
MTTINDVTELTREGAIVVICDGRTFIAGADISEFGGNVPQAAGLHEVQAAMEDAAVPVIAAIHGTALGGGLEVALCAHYRVAVDSAKFGLPEVNLGLLPAPAAPSASRVSSACPRRSR